jgi:hypothetical protein
MIPVKIKLDMDSDLKTKETHVFDLFALHYQPSVNTVDFYTHFRNIVIACLKKKGDVIMWQDRAVLTEDEQLSPTFEELILGIVLSLMDTRLPGHVRNEYRHILGEEQSLMDYKMDILTKAPAFLTQMKANLLAVYKNDGVLRYVVKLVVVPHLIFLFLINL